MCAVCKISTWKKKKLSSIADSMVWLERTNDFGCTHEKKTKSMRGMQLVW